MSVSNGPRRGLMINALTGDGFDADFRKFLRAMDALLMCNVLSKTLSAPPGSPANGDAYLVKATGTGAWATHDNAIAIWSTDNPSALSGEWEFYPAANGMHVYNVADTTIYYWNGAAWTVVAGSAATQSGVEQNSYVYAADTGAANAYVVTLSPVPTIVAGAEVIFKATNANTGASTLAVNGGSATPIKKNGSSALVSGDILAGQIITVVYDGTNYQIQGGTGAGAGSATLAGDTDVVIASPANNDVLTYETSSTKWKNKPAASGFANPMTSVGDVILGGTAGAAGRLAIGSTGQVLAVAGGTAAWTNATGFANPMTTTGDLILGGSSGAAGRLGIGSTGQVLTVVAGTAAWATPAAGGGGALFTMDGSSIAGYTTSGTATAGVTTTSFTPGNFIKTLQVGSLPGAGAAYIDSTLTMAGKVIEFDVGAIHDVTYTIPLVHIIFGANSSGSGPCFRLDGRGSSPNYSGIDVAGSWTSGGGPTDGIICTNLVWYHVKIVINAAGTYASCIINGVAVHQKAITLNGTWIGFTASNGNTGGYVANFRIYAS